jgi:hypothetical protein
MNEVLIKTLIMFAFSFIIAMIVAVLIFLIRKMLTSVILNSLFDEKSKVIVKRARRIHNIHNKTIFSMAINREEEIDSDLIDFYKGINDHYIPVDVDESH